MLRLRSFHGLKYVFGLVTDYKQWRAFWFKNTCKFAKQNQVSKIDHRSQMKEANETDQVEEIAKVLKDSPPRLLFGSDIYPWNSPQLLQFLVSLILKMNDSPIHMVEEISSIRPYIVLDKEKWVWAKVQWKKDVLNRSKMPSTKTKQFILLKDLRGGADGRVWVACTTSGCCCVIKFASFHAQDKVSNPLIMAQRRLVHEIEMHHQAGVKEARLITLGGRNAMILPYFKQVDFDNLNPGEVQAIVDSINKLAREKRVFHGDMKKEHVVKDSPSKRYNFIDLTSARKIEDKDNIEDLIKQMIGKLNLNLKE